MKVVWTELAIEKLESYADYIALDNPSAALKWIKKIHLKVKKLNQFPQSGRKVPEINREEIREVVEGNYRIIYKIVENQTYILTIRHSKQLLDQSNL